MAFVLAGLQGNHQIKSRFSFMCLNVHCSNGVVLKPLFESHSFRMPGVVFLPLSLWETLTRSCSSLLHITNSLWKLPPLCCHHMLYFPSKCEYSQSLCLLYHLLTRVCVSMSACTVCAFACVSCSCLHEWMDVCVETMFSLFSLQIKTPHRISLESITVEFVLLFLIFQVLGGRT